MHIQYVIAVWRKWVSWVVYVVLVLAARMSQLMSQVESSHNIII